MRARHRKNMPFIWLVTDERVPPAMLLASAARLPRGRGGILFRHYRTESRERRALFDRVAKIARRRRLVLILAGSMRQAAAWGADGWHGRDAGWVARPMFRSMAVHNARELQVAERAGAGIIFLSPLFATRSHPGGRVLGRLGFATLAHRATMPVVALGGVREGHRRMLMGLGASGWAAIDGLTGGSGVG